MCAAAYRTADHPAVAGEPGAAPAAGPWHLRPRQRRRLPAGAGQVLGLDATPPDRLGCPTTRRRRIVESFVKSLRPKWTVGARADDAEPLTRWIPYRLYQHEVLRWLEVAGLAGAPPVTLEPSIAVTDADRQRAEQVMPSSSGPVVAVHAGARDARRRWPAKHFATVVSQCVNDGARVVIVGTPHEQELMREIAERARATVPCADADAVVTLSDLDLSALCGVLARCDVLVGNDSGVRHLAKAVGTATVGIFWLPNVFHYAPLGRSRDRVLMSWTSRCTVCDRDCVSAAPCSHDSSFVSDISPDAVMKELRDLLV